MNTKQQKFYFETVVDYEINQVTELIDSIEIYQNSIECSDSIIYFNTFDRFDLDLSDSLEVYSINKRTLITLKEGRELLIREKALGKRLSSEAIRTFNRSKRESSGGLFDQGIIENLYNIKLDK